MKKTNFLLAVVAIILLSAIILRIQQLRDSNSQEPVKEELVEEKQEIVQENKIEKEEELFLEIIDPSSGELITSPFLVKGLIPSAWLDKGDYFVVLVDRQDNNIVDISKLQTEKDWQTGKKVPFYASLEFIENNKSGLISIRRKQNNQLYEVSNFKDININY